MLDFRQITLFLFRISPLKAQNDYIFQKFGGDSPHGYAYIGGWCILLRIMALILPERVILSEEVLHVELIWICNAR